jgi:hypothetical protein
MTTEQKILEITLEILNTIYQHRGEIGEQNYKELSKKIVDLYKELGDKS